MSLPEPHVVVPVSWLGGSGEFAPCGPVNMTPVSGHTHHAGSVAPGPLGRRMGDNVSTGVLNRLGEVAAHTEHIILNEGYNACNRCLRSFKCLSCYAFGSRCSQHKQRTCPGEMPGQSASRHHLQVTTLALISNLFM